MAGLQDTAEFGANGAPSVIAVVQNHPIYWFEDGSLILEIPNTSRFRVHLTLLSRHSRFFAALSKVNVYDTDANNHVILNHQIRLQDVEVLLQHLYHDIPLGQDSPFTRAASILRVTGPKQLDFPQLHAIAREAIERMFPDKPAAFTHDHPLPDALAIATDFNLTSVRKVVLYSLVTTTDFDLPEEGASTMDPQNYSSCGLDSASSNSVRPDFPVGHCEVGTCSATGNLSQKDARICMTLMTCIIDHFTPVLFTPAATPHMKCTDVFAETWMPLVIQPGIQDDGVYKPLETLERIKAIDWATHGLCASCVVEKREEWTQEQRTVWRMMDSWLGDRG